MMKEVWKDIEDYEGLYKISNLGRVSTTKRKGTNQDVISQHDDTHGYLQVQLFKDGVGKRFKVHRLLASAFIPNPENKPTVDHIDRNRRNNNLENLRWATYNEQRSNQSSGEKEVIAIKGTQELTFSSVSECARVIGSNSSNVTSCCKGRRKSVCGYSIKYKECNK